MWCWRKMLGISWKEYRTNITGCAVAQHCCNDDQQSQWENGDFDPCRSETPENFITKIGHTDYVAGATRRPNFMGIGLGVSARQIAKI